MGFWKLFFSFIITSTLSNFMYLHMEFFRYKIFSELTVINIAKLLIELFLFACIYMTVYFLFENAPKWCMRYKYDSAEKLRQKQQE